MIGGKNARKATGNVEYVIEEVREQVGGKVERCLSEKSL